MKRYDFLLLIFFISFGALIVFMVPSAQKGEQLFIYRYGEFLAQYPLKEDRVLDFDWKKSINQVSIKDGEVWMSGANCYNQHCLEHKPISKSGENIVCLPHGFVLLIKGAEEEIQGVLN